MPKPVIFFADLDRRVDLLAVDASLNVDVKASPSLNLLIQIAQPILLYHPHDLRVHAVSLEFNKFLSFFEHVFPKLKFLKPPRLVLILAEFHEVEEVYCGEKGGI